MCFEVAYDGLLRNLVNHGADVIVVPTNNATYTGTGQIEQQFAMSRLRAVETGRYVVVASTNGISGIVAPDGHVVAQAPQRRQVVLERQVELIHGSDARRRARSVARDRPVDRLRAFACSSPLAVGYRRRARAGDDSSRRGQVAEREA